MAIEKRWRGREKYFTLVCDCCGDEAGEFDEFQDAVDEKRDYGFHSVNDGGEWFDLCEECWNEVENKQHPTAADDFVGL